MSSSFATASSKVSCEDCYGDYTREYCITCKSKERIYTLCSRHKRKYLPKSSEKCDGCKAFICGGCYELTGEFSSQVYCDLCEKHSFGVDDSIAPQSAALKKRSSYKQECPKCKKLPDGQKCRDHTPVKPMEKGSHYSKKTVVKKDKRVRF